jgi:hypothetical protein
VWEAMAAIRKILAGIDPNNPAPTVFALLQLQGEWQPLIAAAFPDAPVIQAPVFPVKH